MTQTKINKQRLRSRRNNQRRDERRRGLQPGRMLVLDRAKIKRLREEMNLGMADAAQLAGFTGRAWWFNFESGEQSNVTLTTLERIAAVLEVNPIELLIHGGAHDATAATGKARSQPQRDRDALAAV